MTGLSLDTLAALAEIIGAGAVVSGIIFGWIQLRHYRAQQRNSIAINLMNTFYNADLARAISRMHEIPDGASADEIRNKGQEYTEAALIVSTTFETMGLMAYKKLAPMDLVVELVGGIVVSMHRKLASWLVAVRNEQKQPSFAEWFEWLALVAQEQKDEDLSA